MRALLIFAFITLIALIGNASALTVNVQDATGSVGESIDVSIQVQDAQNLGAMDLVISYNPEIAKIKSVGKGELNKGLISSNTERAGIVTIGIADSKGISGSGEIAVITFEALKEGTSDIMILGVKAYDVNTHAEIEVNKQDGKITVVGKEEKKSPGFEIGIAIAALVALALRRR